MSKINKKVIEYKGLDKLRWAIALSAFNSLTNRFVDRYGTEHITPQIKNNHKLLTNFAKAFSKKTGIRIDKLSITDVDNQIEKEFVKFFKHCHLDIFDKYTDFDYRGFVGEDTRGSNFKVTHDRSMKNIFGTTLSGTYASTVCKMHIQFFYGNSKLLNSEINSMIATIYKLFNTQLRVDWIDQLSILSTVSSNTLSLQFLSTIIDSVQQVSNTLNSNYYNVIQNFNADYSGMSLVNMTGRRWAEKLYPIIQEKQKTNDKLDKKFEQFVVSNFSNLMRQSADEIRSLYAEKINNLIVDTIIKSWSMQGVKGYEQFSDEQEYLNTVSEQLGQRFYNYDELAINSRASDVWETITVNGGSFVSGSSTTANTAQMIY